MNDTKTSTESKDTLMAQAKAYLAQANDTTLPIAERKEAFEHATDYRKRLKTAWKNIGEVPTFEPEAPAKDPTADIAKDVKVPVKGKKAAAAPKEIVAGHLVLRNAIQVALFNEIVQNEIVSATGRWGKTDRPTGHGAPWAVVQVRASLDDGKTDPVGIDFEAPKVNYNVNDSNWVNDGKVTKNLQDCATKANGGVDVNKKMLYSLLEDMKHIFGMTIPKANDQVTETKVEQEAAAA